MWITISSGILGFSFIFGNSIRTVFESCLTLFVVHPFDVGDTIFIEGGYHVVEEASLNKVHDTKPLHPRRVSDYAAGSDGKQACSWASCTEKRVSASAGLSCSCTPHLAAPE